MISALGSETRFLHLLFFSPQKHEGSCFINSHSFCLFIYSLIDISLSLSLLVLSVLSRHKYIGEQVRCERTLATPAAWGLWLFQHRAAGQRNPIAQLWVTFKSAPGLCSPYQTSAGIFQCHFKTITTLGTFSELWNWQS